MSRYFIYRLLPCIFVTAFAPTQLTTLSPENEMEDNGTFPRLVNVAVQTQIQVKVLHFHTVFTISFCYIPKICVSRC